MQIYLGYGKKLTKAYQILRQGLQLILVYINTYIQSLFLEILEKTSQTIDEGVVVNFFTQCKRQKLILL